MAEVWRVSHGGKTVALKLLLPQFSEDDTFRDMLADEVAILSRIRHENIVSVNGLHNIDGRMVVEMAYVEGLNLQQLAATASRHRRRIPVPAALFVVHEVARGLAYALSMDRNLVHRDIAPANIMLDREGQVRVLDFGVARASDRATSTAIGTIKGRLDYMAPEHAAGRALTAQVDVFSLGVVLWEMLAMRRLYVGDGTVASALRRSAAPSLLQQAVLVHPEVTSLVARMLDFDPEKRPRMGEVAERLNAVLGAEAGSARDRLAEEVVRYIPMVRRSTAVLPAPSNPHDITEEDPPPPEEVTAGPTTSSNPILQFDPWSSESDARRSVCAGGEPLHWTASGRLTGSAPKPEGRPHCIADPVQSPWSAPLPVLALREGAGARRSPAWPEPRGSEVADVLRRRLNLALVVVVTQAALIAALLVWKWG